jgi:hypothetical protein
MEALKLRSIMFTVTQVAVRISHLLETQQLYRLLIEICRQVVLQFFTRCQQLMMLERVQKQTL